ncbi:hypothetical protein AB0H82_04385 [Streptomyces sp. NPDC050732]
MTSCIEPAWDLPIVPAHVPAVVNTMSSVLSPLSVSGVVPFIRSE